MRRLTLDAVKKKTLQGNFKPSSTAERDFYRSLRRVAQASGHIVEQHVDGVRIADDKRMQEELARYSEKLTPWAQRQSEKLLNQVQNSNKRAYTKKSKAIGSALQVGVGDQNVLDVARRLLDEQVALIQSIPIEAGNRAKKIAFEAAMAGTRAEANADTIEELQRQLGLTTEVATSRALLISRTETARATAAINQARATAVGSGQYRWHNSGDESVRESHRVYKGKPLQGRVFSWDDPPTLSDGMRGNPGEFPNCRCFAEPVFNDE